MSKNNHKPVIIWLFTGVFLILVMVIIGGVTRLTHSGLSMVEWSFIGSAPPVTQQDWQVWFDKYQESPEFKELNSDYNLEDFQYIFWWEYVHRQFGRFIGVVFLIPFLFFFLYYLITGGIKTRWRLFRQLLIVLGLGVAQALLGWFMVKSGLVKEPRVSHFRLAAHLVTAFITCAYTFWVALDLIYENNAPQQAFQSIRKWSKWLLPFILVQITFGAFVAGLGAGGVHNTFPMMDGEWMPEAVTAMDPVWVNFFQGRSGVQFAHRYLAYAVTLLVGLVWWKSRKLDLDSSQRKAVNALGATVVLQFVLGVMTLLFAVPLVLGGAHQIGALLLLLSAVMVTHRFRLAT